MNPSGEFTSLRRSSSTTCYRNITSSTAAVRTLDSSSSRRILPSSTTSTSSSASTPSSSSSSTDKSLVTIHSHSHRHHTTTSSSSSSPVLSLTHRISTTTRSLFSSLLRTLTSTLPTTTRRRLSLTHTTTTTPTLGRKVTGTLFGHRKDHVTFAVQDTPASDPVLLVELATSTSSLVKEMSSGLVRLALECRRKNSSSTHHNSSSSISPTATSLYGEPVWTMYCNGKKCGYATARPCSECDRHVLDTIRSVSVGAGVIPPMSTSTKDGNGMAMMEEVGTGSGGEMLYMRARFERVVGSRDSEAFYMLNPDGNGGPDLSIFLLRL